jgi:hypothetical protein
MVDLGKPYVKCGQGEWTRLSHIEIVLRQRTDQLIAECRRLEYSAPENVLAVGVARYAGFSRGFLARLGLEQRADKIVRRVMHAGSCPDGVSQRVLFDSTAEILVAAATQGTFNFHRIVHAVRPFNQAAYRRTYLPAIINPGSGARDDISLCELLSRPQSRKKVADVGRRFEGIRTRMP